MKVKISKGNSKLLVKGLNSKDFKNKEKPRLKNEEKKIIR